MLINYVLKQSKRKVNGPSVNKKKTKKNIIHFRLSIYSILYIYEFNLGF